MDNFKLLGLLLMACTAWGQKEKGKVVLDTVQRLDEVILEANTILSNKYVAQNRTGAAYYISTKELKKFNPNDINRVLQSVPGVTFYEEDGFGLRPNISLRGTSPQRSSKITLMEDGVLIAPAPYSAPAAYYFPTIARMQAVEILKGSSQVQYGPFTTGGAINMVSSAIPDSLSLRLGSRYGSFNTTQIQASIGQTLGRLGYLLEYQNSRSSGFKQLVNNQNTGFKITDMLGKLRWTTYPNAQTPQYIELKYHFYNQTSNETYLGLSEDDFNNTPFLRYAASSEDQMKAERTQFMLTHVVDFSTQFKVITNVYQNRFSRNWYKLDDVVFGNEKKNLTTVLNDPFQFSNHMQILRGTRNGGSNALWVKANNRAYTARGIQTKIDYHWYDTQGSFHDIEVGGRLHYDEEDRFQWEDGYSISNGQMALTTLGPRGAQGNRISKANARAAYALYKYKWKNLTLTPGFRYEHIILAREDYGKDDPDRTALALQTRENIVKEVIPGMGFNYNFSNQLSLFGGVHKGFSPPGNAPGEKAEESLNYELGTRFLAGNLRGEWIGFFNNYTNLLGSDLAASGGTGSLDQFNAGAVHVSGFEVLLNYDFQKANAKINVPLSIAYTLTNALFKSDFGSKEDIWGQVKTDDRVPYIPQHQFNFTTSLVHPRYEFNFNLRYNGAFNTQASNGGLVDPKPIASNVVVDLSAKYPVASKTLLTAHVINLFNQVYAASRVPSGLRPGHPFGIYAGLEINL